MPPAMPRTTAISGPLTFLFAAMSGLVIIGFYPSYFSKLLDTSFSFHVHGLLMFAWMGALIAQATFIRTHRMDLHRRAGKLSFALAPLIVLSGVIVIRETYDGIEMGREALQRLSVPAFAIAQFALSYALAMAYRRRPELHARYMISTGLVLTFAGTLRMFLNWAPGISSGPDAVNANYFLFEMVTAGLILNDLRLGQLRAPFVLTLILFGTNHIFFATARDLAWWRTLATWIVG
jgi:hypothetical protein